MINAVHLGWKSDWSAHFFALAQVLRQKDGSFSVLFDEEKLHDLEKEFDLVADSLVKKLKEQQSQIVLLHDLLLRIPPVHRWDGQMRLRFWQADDERYDDFDRLALTQGRKANDDLEFWAEFPVVPNMRFTTNLWYVNGKALGELSVGMELTYGFESDNRDEVKSVAILNPQNKQVLGYVKPYHNYFFHDCRTQNLTPKITVQQVINYKQRAELYVLVALPDFTTPH